MNFNQHSDLTGKHAFLSASNYHWINYTPEKLVAVFQKQQAKERGTKLHDLACNLITMGVKLPNNKKTINQYVNDAIDLRLKPEQLLYYSKYAFGTADTINYSNNILRVHDLKTGDSPVSFNQLVVYTALFCLEYAVDPYDIDLIELRIYQKSEVKINYPERELISSIMQRIVTNTEILTDLEEEEAMNV